MRNGKFLSWFLVFGAAGLFALGCASNVIPAVKPSCAKGEFPVRGMIAHRGDAAEYPENTMPAFIAAVAKGAEMVELDEWRCRTGELVVMHDARREARRAKWPRCCAGMDAWRRVF